MHCVRSWRRQCAHGRRNRSRSVPHKAPPTTPKLLPPPSGWILAYDLDGKSRATICAGLESNIEVDGASRHALTMRSPTPILFASLLAVCGGISLAQDAPPAPVLQSEVDEQHALLERVIANQKKTDLAQFTYERLERLEIHKGAAGPQPPEIKTTRAVPAGTGIGRIPVGPAGKPVDAPAFRGGFEKLQPSLCLAAGGGGARHTAY